MNKDLKSILKSSGTKLFSNLLQSSVQVHIMHLQSKSYAEHMTLGSFYEAIPGLTDSLIGEYQGKYGIINNYQSISLSTQDPITYFKNLRTIVDSTRCTEIKDEDTNLQNTIDEIVSLIDSTLYKLINLK